jgi:LysR family transcriptional activator of nhaA
MSHGQAERRDLQEHRREARHQRHDQAGEQPPSHHAAVRLRIDQWLERHGLHPRLVGEFEDSALLKTFGAGGLGVFPVATRVHDELVRRYRVRRIGPCEGVEEHFFAIGTERRVQHPLVQRLLAK